MVAGKLNQSHDNSHLMLFKLWCSLTNCFTGSLKSFCYVAWCLTVTPANCPVDNMSSCMTLFRILRCFLLVHRSRQASRCKKCLAQIVQEFNRFVSTTIPTYSLHIYKTCETCYIEMYQLESDLRVLLMYMYRLL